jgi:hypothetical protein
MHLNSSSKTFFEEKHSAPTISPWVPFGHLTMRLCPGAKTRARHNPSMNPLG